MSREQDFLLGAIEKDKVIAQQQARIEELKLALDKADPLDPSFLRYLELEQQLQAERERAEKAEAKAEGLRNIINHDTERLQAEREKSATVSKSNWFQGFIEKSEECFVFQQRLHDAEAERDAAHARIVALERQLERHTRLLHIAVHNWALHSVVDCPELECEEYRALFSPAPEEKQ